MAELQDSVHIIDCIWEYFVLVGEKARGRRRDIRLAISVAQVIFLFAQYNVPNS
jgi:hypothetical protein